MGADGLRRALGSGTMGHVSSLDPAEPADARDHEPGDPVAATPMAGTPGSPLPAEQAADSGAVEGEGPGDGVADEDDEGREDADLEDDELADDAPPVRTASLHRGPGHLSGEPGRLLRSLAAVLAVAVVFGSGVLVGRITAPRDEPVAAASGGAADVGASAASPVPSAGPAASSPLAGLASDGPVLGSATAKVQLTYWADYQCPFCTRFAETVLPQLASRIADGTVAVTHRDFVFLGPESLDAAIAVQCAGEQGRYWPMHDAVYAAQDGENRGAFSAATLTRLAAGVGADSAAFTDCTQRHDVLVAVLADTGAGVRASVSSTPTMDIPGRRFLGVPDAAAFLQAIDDAATAGTAPTAAPSAAPSGDPWADTATSGRTAGSAAAPVTVELWLDYQATGVPALVQTLEPELRTRIAEGKVRLVLRDLATLGEESTAAASLIRCGSQDHEPSVWLAHDVLAVSAQGANAGVFTSRSLLWFAAKLGWDVTALDACMADPATASAVQAETSTGVANGLTAAPTVVVIAGAKEAARFSGSSIDAARVLAAVDAAVKK